MAGRRRRPLPAGTRGLPARTLLTALAEEPLAALEAAAAPEPPPSVGRGVPAVAPAALEPALEALEAAAAAALRLLFSFRFFLSRLAKKSSRLRSSVSAMAAAGRRKEGGGGGPGQEVSVAALPLLGERGRLAAAAAVALAGPARRPAHPTPDAARRERRG